MVYKNSLLLPLRKRSKNASIFLNNWLLKVVSATFWPITMFKGQSLLFHVVSETLITQNYLLVIPNNVVRFTCLLSLLSHFKTKDDRGKHNFEKQYYCGNYSDDVCQGLNTDRFLLKIRYLMAASCKRFWINE